ncbi:MAG: methyltransferase [Casimicrobium sp.]
MAGSKFSLPPIKRTGGDPEARSRQLQAVEADIQAGRLEEAASMLNELAQADRNDVRVYLAGWMLASKAGNVAAALQSAERAVVIAPMSAIAHYCLSEAQQGKGDVAAARTSINQALMLSPTNLRFRELAVNLANAQADHAASEVHLRTAFAQSQDIPGIKTMIGNALRYQSKFEEAETWLSEALVINPDDADALHGLAMLAYLRDDRATAQHFLAAALKHRPTDTGYLYLDAVFKGEAPSQPPENLTRGLFDRYAGRFDTHLVGALKYRIPQKIAAAILARFPDRKLNVLDIGCGTGLLGASLGRIDGFFVGVDLSKAMLEEAAKHNVYSRFHHVNLLDALEATDANEYEVIAAGDVFIYLGALDAAITNAFKVLRPGGWMFFSCEDTPDDGPDFVVRKSMRYAQSQKYVKQLLETAGFDTPSIETLDLRMEQDEAITGFLVSVQKPV